MRQTLTKSLGNSNFQSAQQEFENLDTNDLSIA